MKDVLSSTVAWVAPNFVTGFWFVTIGERVLASDIDEYQAVQTAQNSHLSGDASGVVKLGNEGTIQWTLGSIDFEPALTQGEKP